MRLCSWWRGPCHPLRKDGGWLLWVTAVVVLWMTTCVSAELADRVLLDGVSTLTFADGIVTRGRRIPPRPQLTCTGGTAQNHTELYPSFVRCVNRGRKDAESSIEWLCEASLKENVIMSSMDVKCEGFGYPEDRFILKNSCALEFTLDFTEERNNTQEAAVPQETVSNREPSAAHSQSFFTEVLVPLSFILVTAVLFNVRRIRSS